MVQHPFLTTRATIFMGGVTALSAITTDILLPATGVIARDYQVPEAQGALIIGLYLLAYGVGQLLWGLVSDAYGRKPALQISLLAFSLASLACAFAPSFEWLLALRFLQGLCAGAPVICRAMVRDIAQGREAGRILALLGAVLTSATMVAPILGSLLLIAIEWRAIFCALMLFSLIYLAYSAGNISETLPKRRPERLSLSFVLPNAKRLLGQRAFGLPAVQGGLVFAGYASLLSTGAILTEALYALSETGFGLYFMLAALANTAGALLSRQLLKRNSLYAVNRIAIAVITVATLACGLLYLSTPNLMYFWSVICLYVFAFGMSFPISNTLALEPAGDTPGFAAALIGTLQLTLGALGALLATLAYSGSHHSIAMAMALCGGLSAIVGHLQRQDTRP